MRATGQCYEISRHPGLNPGSIFHVEANLLQKWIPAFAGMTEGFAGFSL